MESYNSTHTGAEIDSYVTKQELINLIYLIGSIYISVNNVSPATLFGGTWEQIQDRFLLGAGNEYIIGNTGGEAEHTLTVNEMPSHGHRLWSGYDNGDTTDGYDTLRYQQPWANGNRGYNLGAVGVSRFIELTGGDQPHNNMPPYLAVNIWKRTA